MGACRFPRGKRGLKFTILTFFFIGGVSLPPREAWIEIHSYVPGCLGPKSLPPREAWIEINDGYVTRALIQVASPAGSVD